MVRLVCTRFTHFGEPWVVSMHRESDGGIQMAYWDLLSMILVDSWKLGSAQNNVVPLTKFHTLFKLSTRKEKLHHDDFRLHHQDKVLLE